MQIPAWRHIDVVASRIAFGLGFQKTAHTVERLVDIFLQMNEPGLVVSLDPDLLIFIYFL